MYCMKFNSNYSNHFSGDLVIEPPACSKNCFPKSDNNRIMAGDNFVDETITKLLGLRRKSSEDINLVDSSDVRDDTPWPTDPAAYELMEVIGEGSTATVNAAVCIPRNHERCAIKRINLEVSDSLDELIKETQAMSRCNHENVVHYYTSFVTKDELWLVMRLSGGGSLLDIIKYRLQHEDCSKGVFDEATISTFLRETLKGLEYFHNHGQIHRDIKAGNILLGTDGSIQIADFGVAALLSNDVADGGTCHYTFVGTPCFMAPEVMEQQHGYNSKADIWSLGILAIELATGKAPYHKFPPMKVLMLTLQNEPPTLETNADHKDQYKHFSKAFRHLLAECLQKDPNKRPTATELLKHPFFRRAKDKNFLKHTLIDTGPGMAVKKPGDVTNIEDGRTNSSRESHRSGRFYRAISGEWEFSPDEEEEDENEECSEARMPQISDEDDTLRGESALSKAAVSTSTMPAERTLHGPPATPNVPPTTVPMSDVVDSAGHTSPNDNGTTANAAVQRSGNTVKEAATAGGRETSGFVLRARNAARELNDIRFEFALNQDTADGIASELVLAGLIDGRDRVVMAANLAKLIENYGHGADRSKSIIFSLPSGAFPGEVPDEGSLKGFAQLTVIH